MIYTVTYFNKHNKSFEVAGYADTLKKAKRLAKVFTDPRIVECGTIPEIWMGQPGGMTISY